MDRKKQMDDWMDGWIGKNRWMIGRTGKKQNHGQIDRKMDDWMARKKIDGWLDGWKTYI